MRGGISPAIVIAAACALLAACAPPPTPVRALPPGATPEEVADYARALAQYRWARASATLSRKPSILGRASPKKSSRARTPGCSRRTWYVRGTGWPGRGIRPTCGRPSRRNSFAIVSTSTGGTTRRPAPSAGTWKRGSRRPISPLSLRPAPSVAEPNQRGRRGILAGRVMSGS